MAGQVAEITAENWLDGLDDRETIFVLEYLKTLNVRAAARAAGYAERVAITTAYLWVTPPSGAPSSDSKRKPLVYRAVQFGLDQRRNEQLVTAEMVIRELKAIAFVNPRKALKWRAHKVTETDEDHVDPDNPDQVTTREIVSNTVEVFDSESLDDETAAAIKEIRQNADGSVTIKFHDKRAALQDLAKHLGIMDERVRHLGPTGGPVQVITTDMTPEEAAKAWQASLDAEGE